MKKYQYILFFLPFLVIAQEQQEEQQHEQQQGSKKGSQEEVKIKLADKQVLRKGNDLYREKKYADAEAKYKKALQQNQYYRTAYYNLSNSMYSQDKFKESLPGYELVAKTTEDKAFKAQSFHNIGNVLLKEKQYAKAISAFKNSLRLNPKDDETRYNLALAQDLLKNQQNQENKDNKDNKDKDKEEDKKDQNSENKEEEGDEDKKDQEQDKGEDNKDKQDQDKGGDNEQENKQPPKPEPNKLSQQQIQQLLEAMNNEENKTQKKVNAKKASGKKVKQEKDW